LMSAHVRFHRVYEHDCNPLRRAGLVADRVTPATVLQVAVMRIVSRVGGSEIGSTLRARFRFIL
jgi:hypothetical protein